MTKRLLFITGEYPPDSGGIGTMVYELASGLYQGDWEIVVLAYRYASTEDALAAFIDKEPYPIWRLNSKTDWYSITKAIQQFRPDMLITGDLPLSFIVRLLGFLFRIPVLLIGYGSEFRRSSLPVRLLKKIIYETSHYVVMISQYTANLAVSIGIRLKRVSIIHPAGDENLRPDVDSQFLRERYGLEGKRVLLTLGTVSERKGQDKVIKALPKIIKQFPDVHYLIAGRDTTNAAFSRLAEELGIQEHLTFTGMFDNAEKAAFFNLAEFCLITSHSLSDGNVEGFGIVVIEAALCRRASIGTYGTGVEETMIDGKTGLLVLQNDIAAIEAAITRLLANPTLRQELEENAYLSAKETATWAKRVQQFEALLQKILL